MFELIAKGNRLDCTKKDKMTTGMSGVTAHFTFDSKWDGLAKTVVITNGVLTKDLTESYSGWISGDIVTIPPVFFETVGKTITIGVYGTNGATVVIPTVCAYLGTVFQGTDPLDDTEIISTPTIAEQVTQQAANARESADNAELDKIAADEARDNAEGYASRAEAARDEAVENAEESQENADYVRKHIIDAESAADRASTSASEALTSASKSEESASKARISKDEADDSRSKAEAARDTAIQKASESVQKAEEALQSAINAAASEASASQEAEQASGASETAVDSMNKAIAAMTTAQQTLSDLLAMMGNDIATLVGGKIPISQIPATATTEIYRVNDDSQLTSLTAQHGDLAELVETVDGEDTITKTWQLLGTDPTKVNDWVVWGTSYAVQAGSASIAENASNSSKINNHRLAEIPSSEFATAVVDDDSYYLVYEEEE